MKCIFMFFYLPIYLGNQRGCVRFLIISSGLISSYRHIGLMEKKLKNMRGLFLTTVVVYRCTLKLFEFYEKLEK